MQEFIAAYTSGLVGCDTDHPPEAMALSHAFAALGESYFPVETSFSLEDWCASLLCVQLRSAPSVGDCSAKQLPQPDGTGWVARTHDHQQGQMLTRVSLVILTQICNDCRPHARTGFGRSYGLRSCLVWRDVHDQK